MTLLRDRGEGDKLPKPTKNYRWKYRVIIAFGGDVTWKFRKHSKVHSRFNMTGTRINSYNFGPLTIQHQKI